MTTIKQYEFNDIIKNRTTNFAVFLIYGPNNGLVLERSKQLSCALADHNSMSCMDADHIMRDPWYLWQEAYGGSLFANKHIFLIKGVSGRQEILQALAPFTESNKSHITIILEAGDLKKSSALRKTIESNPNSAAVPCYNDGLAEIFTIIEEELRSASLLASPDAKDMLARVLHGDRLMIRSELQKLCMYCADKALLAKSPRINFSRDTPSTSPKSPGTHSIHATQTIDVQDVEAIIDGCGQFLIDKLLDSLLKGANSIAFSIYNEAIDKGHDVSHIGIVLANHIRLLQALRSKIDSGISAKSAVDAASPPIFFKRKTAIIEQLSKWSHASLAKALTAIYRATLGGRKNPELRTVFNERMLAEVARLGRKH